MPLGQLISCKDDTYITISFSLSLASMHWKEKERDTIELLASSIIAATQQAPRARSPFVSLHAFLLHQWKSLQNRSLVLVVLGNLHKSFFLHPLVGYWEVVVDMVIGSIALSAKHSPKLHHRFWPSLVIWKDVIL